MNFDSQISHFSQYTLVTQDTSTSAETIRNMELVFLKLVKYINKIINCERLRRYTKEENPYFCIVNLVYEIENIEKYVEV